MKGPHWTNDQIAALREIAQHMGYTFERTESAGTITERMIRPDGSVAITATKKKGTDAQSVDSERQG